MSKAALLKLSQQVAQRRSVLHGEQEAAYLYGFVDPTMAARGPMRSEVPTVIATLCSSTTMTLRAPSATPTSFSGTAPTGNYELSGTAGGATGDMNIACGPTVFTDKRTGTTFSGFFPGYVFDPTLVLTSATFGGGAAKVAPKPFGTYTAQYPALPTSDLLQDTFNPNFDGRTTQAYRILGCRATMTVNSSLLESYGQVYVSDNNSYLPDKPALNPTLLSTGYVSDFPDIGVGELYQLPVLNGSNSSRAVNAGAFKYGKTYETSFVPANDAVLDFKEGFPTQCRCTTNSFGTMLGQPLVAGPYCMFHLVGVPADTVITINTVVAFELPVRLNSSIGWLMASSRIAMNYAVDWSVLARVPTGGDPGTQVLAYITDPSGKLGFGMASGAFAEPGIARPVNIGINARSSTQLVMTAARGAPEDVQMSLQNASDTARSPVDHVRNVVGAIGAATGNHHAAHAVQAAITLAEKAYGFYKEKAVPRLAPQKSQKQLAPARITEIVEVKGGSKDTRGNRKAGKQGKKNK